MRAQLKVAPPQCLSRLEGTQCERDKDHPGPHWLTVWEVHSPSGESFPAYPEMWDD